MNASRRRAVGLLVLMVASVVSAEVWQPTRHLSDEQAKIDLESVFPRQFGQWRVDDQTPTLLVSPDQQALLNRIYNQTLSRTYVNDRGDRIMLAVAYGGDQSDGTRAHRPEVCYPAQGFEILSDSLGTVSVGTHRIPARRLVAKLGSRIEPITYWVTVGDHIALSGTQQKLAQLTFTMRGLIPDGMLVRVSTIDSDYGRAYAQQQAFLDELAAALPDAHRDRILGRAPT